MTPAQNSIKCPFHHWEFDTAGVCKSIPYSTASIPAAANTKSHRVKVFNRAIL